MLLSVIIPTYNRNEMLALCLAKLAPGSQALDAMHYEVIVSDDGLNNQAKGLIYENYPWVLWTEGPKRGPAANRNNGAKKSSGEWLVFTDDDCLPDRNWLMAFAKAIEEYPNIKAFEGAILPDDWNLLSADMAECPVNDKGGCFWSANITIERKFFQSIGGFDEQFRIAAQEDQDLQMRVLQQTSIAFIENAFVIHPVRTTQLFQAISQVPNRITNYLYYATKYRSKLGYTSKRQLVWERGIKMQAISCVNDLKKQHWKKALVALYNCMNYLPIYFKS